MSKRIEQLLRLVADMEKFSNEIHLEASQLDSAEMSFEELELIAAAALPPDKLSAEKG